MFGGVINTDRRNPSILTKSFKANNRVINLNGVCRLYGIFSHILSKLHSLPSHIVHNSSTMRVHRDPTASKNTQSQSLFLINARAAEYFFYKRKDSFSPILFFMFMPWHKWLKINFTSTEIGWVNCLS
jgi:hypothetical protein